MSDLELKSLKYNTEVLIALVFFFEFLVFSVTKCITFLPFFFEGNALTLTARALSETLRARCFSNNSLASLRLQVYIR